MSLHRHVKPLLSIQAGLADQVGKTYAILPSDADRALDHSSTWYLFIQLPAPPSVPTNPPGGGTTCCPCPPACAPTEVPNLAHVAVVERPEVDIAPPELTVSTVVVETSPDGVSWVDIMDPLELDALPTLMGPLVLGPYVRAKTVSHGSSTHSVEVILASNAPFRLEPVA